MQPKGRAGSNLPPEHCRATLLLVDVINRFDFEGSDALLRSARSAAVAIARLKTKAIDAKVPVVYVNDNFGRWRSDFRSIVRSCRAPEQKAAAREIVERLAGHPDRFIPGHDPIVSEIYPRASDKVDAFALHLAPSRSFAK